MILRGLAILLGLAGAWLAYAAVVPLPGEHHLALTDALLVAVVATAALMAAVAIWRRGLK